MKVKLDSDPDMKYLLYGNYYINKNLEKNKNKKENNSQEIQKNKKTYEEIYK